jgi:tetratricopeptide (TPR) repeat protein
MTNRSLANTGLRLFFLGIMLFTAGVSFAQSSQSGFTRRIQNGNQLYNIGRFNEASAEFRNAQETAVTLDEWSRALYWVILSELGATDYGSAIRDMDDLEKHAPNSSYNRDMAYHRGRVYFNQGFFDNALVLFRRFIDTVTDDDRESSDRRAAAYFWTGETLFHMGRFDEAESFYGWVVTRYPGCPKFEISTYRMDLIKQKKIEAELLALLQWSHEESLRTSEDFQRKIRTYEYTLNAYQRRINELTGTVGTPVIPGGMPSRRADEYGQDEEGPAPEDLLERARQLGFNLEQLIRERESGGL